MEPVKCVLCNQDDSHILFYGKDLLYKTTPTEFAVTKCANCGLVYLNPQPTLSELSSYYPDQYGTFNKSSGRSVSKNFLFDLYRKIRESSRLKLPIKKELAVDFSARKFLDFGCGNGKRLEGLRSKHPNWDFYGIDIDPRACLAASRNGFIISCGDILNVKYPENYFDEINSSQVLEHVKNPREVLRELNRILKHGGKLTLDVPNFDSIPAQLFKSKWYNLDVPRHLFQFTPATLTSLFNEADFRILTIKTHTDAKTLLASIDFFLKGYLSEEINPLILNLLRPVSWLLEKLNRADYIFVEATKKASCTF